MGWTEVLLFFRNAGTLQSVNCVVLDSGRKSHLLVCNLALLTYSASRGRRQPMALDDDFLNGSVAE